MKKLALILIAVFLVSACEKPDQKTPDEYFGFTVNHNRSMHKKSECLNDSIHEVTYDDEL